MVLGKIIVIVNNNDVNFGGFSAGVYVSARLGFEDLADAWGRG